MTGVQTCALPISKAEDASAKLQAAIDSTKGATSQDPSQKLGYAVHGTQTSTGYVKTENMREMSKTEVNAFTKFSSLLEAKQSHEDSAKQAQDSMEKAMEDAVIMLEQSNLNEGAKIWSVTSWLEQLNRPTLVKLLLTLSRRCVYLLCQNDTMKMVSLQIDSSNSKVHRHRLKVKMGKVLGVIQCRRTEHRL